MTETKIGVLGGGKIAERHLNGYKKLDGVDITISDIDSSKKAVAEEYGVSWRDDPDSLITDPEFDAIDVCTPVQTHFQLIKSAIESGKDVFCEKPLVDNFDEALELRELVSSTDQNLMVGYLYRFHPAFEFVKNVISDGIIGDPYYAILRVGGRGSHRAWKHKKDTGGGASNEMFVHMLDLALWYFDEPQVARNLYTDVVLGERNIDGETVDADAEDFILYHLTTEDEVEVFCQSDLITPSYMNYIEIHGTNGSVFSSILDYFPAVVYCQEARGDFEQGQNFREFSAVDLFERELGHFVECVHTGKTPNQNTIEDSVTMAEIIESI